MALNIQRKTGELVGSAIDLAKGEELELRIQRVSNQMKLTFESSVPAVAQFMNVAQEARTNSSQFKVVGKSSGTAFLRVYSTMPGGSLIPQASIQVRVSEVSFARLWDNYPSGHPVQGKDAPEDQCTLKLSVALHKIGVDMKSFKGTTTNVNGKPAAMRVKQVAAWLDTKPVPAISKSINITGKTGQAK